LWCREVLERQEVDNQTKDGDEVINVLKRVGTVVTAPIWIPVLVVVVSLMLALLFVASFTILPLIKLGVYIATGSFKVEVIDELYDVLNEPAFLLFSLLATVCWLGGLGAFFSS